MNIEKKENDECMKELNLEKMGDYDGKFDGRTRK